MKLQTNTMLTSLNASEVKSLTTIVKETLAASQAIKKQSLKFSAADLWMIRKQRRSFQTRRFIY